MLVDILRLKTLGKSVWKPFENEFAVNLQTLTRHIPTLDSETALAHRQTLLVDRRRKVMEGLSPVDMEQHYQRENRKRTNGTGQWQMQTYSEWRDFGKPEPILCINSRPGDGKTVLFAYIIGNLQLIWQRRPINESSGPP